MLDKPGLACPGPSLSELPGPETDAEVEAIRGFLMLKRLVRNMGYGSPANRPATAKISGRGNSQGGL